MSRRLAPAALSALILLALAAPAGAETPVPSICPSTQGALDVTITGTPSRVSPSVGTTAYARFEIVVENCSPATKKNAKLVTALLGRPATETLLGTLRSGEQRVLRFTVTTPSTTSAGITSTATVRYQDESTNGNKPEGNLQTAFDDTTTVVGAAAGEAFTWVPDDTQTLLRSAKNGQTADVTVPKQAEGFAAELGRAPKGDFACPDPSAKNCRDGEWFDFDVPGPLGAGGKIAGGLRSTLFWPRDLLNKKQTNTDGLVVYHLLDSGELRTISTWCSTAWPIDCIHGAERTRHGLLVTVLTEKNGRMR